MTWHADQTLLGRYRDDSLSDVDCSSVEAHLLACRECRDEVAQMVPSSELDAAWSEIVTTISTPRPGLLERGLRRLGVSESLAHLVGITPSLQRPWLAGVVLTVVLSVLLAHLTAGDGAALFMLVAPLLPVAGVAVAFGPGVDPTYELVVAAPIRSFDLLMARSAAVLATTVPITAMASAALPVAGWEAVAWVLPAVALTAVTLAAATWVVPWKAAAALCGLWIVATTAYAVGLRPDPVVLDAVAGAEGQMAMVVLLAAALAVLTLRRNMFDLELLR